MTSSYKYLLRHSLFFLARFYSRVSPLGSLWGDIKSRVKLHSESLTFMGKNPAGGARAPPQSPAHSSSHPLHLACLWGASQLHVSLFSYSHFLWLLCAAAQPSYLPSAGGTRIHIFTPAVQVCSRAVKICGSWHMPPMQAPLAAPGSMNNPTLGRVPSTRIGSLPSFVPR